MAFKVEHSSDRNFCNIWKLPSIPRMSHGLGDLPWTNIAFHRYGIMIRPNDLSILGTSGYPANQPMRSLMELLKRTTNSPVQENQARVQTPPNPPISRLSQRPPRRLIKHILCGRSSLSTFSVSRFVCHQPSPVCKAYKSSCKKAYQHSLVVRMPDADIIHRT